MCSRFFCELPLTAPIQTNDIKLALQRASFSRGVKHTAPHLVNSRNFIYFPIAAGQLPLQRAVRSVQIQMTEAAAFAGPEKTIAVAEKLRLALDVNPLRIF